VQEDLNVTAEDFDMHMRYLKKYFSILDLNEAVSCIKSGEIPRNSVVVTFDDGYENFYKVAFPILKQHNIKATVFLVTNLVGTEEGTWIDKFTSMISTTKKKFVESKTINLRLPIETRQDKTKAIATFSPQLKRLGKNKRDNALDEIAKNLGFESFDKIGVPLIYKMMNWKQISETVESRISYGSHTANHPILSRLSKEEVMYELTKSKEKLVGKLKNEIMGVAYPNGHKEDFSEEIKKLSEKSYICGLTTINGTNREGEDIFELKRIGVYYDDILPIFAAKISILRLVSFVRSTLWIK
jgi:peptidoglycan/xylan/chitin deacetylase (PgdA/CDA1 family)